MYLVHWSSVFCQFKARRIWGYSKSLPILDFFDQTGPIFTPCCLIFFPIQGFYLFSFLFVQFSNFVHFSPCLPIIPP